MLLKMVTKWEKMGKNGNKLSKMLPCYHKWLHVNKNGNKMVTCYQMWSQCDNKIVTCCKKW